MTRALPLWVLWLATSCAHPARAPDSATPPMSIEWIGGPTALLQLGPFTLLTDPVFGEGEEAFRIEVDPNSGAPNAAIARRGPLPRFDRSAVTLVLVSHAHQDHFDGEARTQLAEASVPVLLPTHQVPIAEAAGIREAVGLDWWEERRFVDGDAALRIIAVPAQHAHSPEAERFLGKGNGYWLELRQGTAVRTVYWTGDTVTFAGMAEIRTKFGAPDVLLPHLGGVGAGGPLGRISLDAAEAIEVVRRFEPATVVPLHHSTFTLYREPIDALERAVVQSGLQVRLLLLTEGEHTPLR